MKTTVKIHRTFTGDGNLKGIASANFDDCFMVTGIMVKDGKNGLFVTMPQRKVGENEYKDICFPTNKEYRKELSDMVLDAYHQKLEESQEHENKDDQSENPEQKSDDEPSSEEESDPAQESGEGLEETEGLIQGM